MFRTVSLSIFRSLDTEQQVYAIQVMLNCMTYTYCCVYSARLLMMDRTTVRNMWSPSLLHRAFRRVI